MRKNIRTLLLKESLTYQPYSYNKTLNNDKKYSSPYKLIEYSKSKENSYDSNPITINNFKKNSLTIKPKSSLYKNTLIDSRKNKILPLLNKNKTINNSKNRLFKSFNDFLFSQIRTKLIKKDKNKSNTFNKHNLLMNSIEVKKNYYPKYIFLSKIFNINESKSKKDFFNINKVNSNQKSISYKIKNKEDYNNYINKRVKLNYNYNFDSSFVHKINSEYMIKKLNEKYPIKSYNEYEFSDEKEEITKEKRDKVDDNILNNKKIFDKIKNVLFNHNKKYILGKETKLFFESKENIFNFLYDIYLVPQFKNNLLKKGGLTFQKKLEEENYIDHKTWKYLNMIKIKLQKLKDDSNYIDFIPYEEEVLNKENKDNKDNNENKENLENKDINKTEVKNNEDNIKYKDKYESFENEDYLSKKKENQSIVNLIDEKTKKFFYGTFLKIHNKN